MTGSFEMTADCPVSEAFVSGFQRIVNLNLLNPPYGKNLLLIGCAFAHRFIHPEKIHQAFDKAFLFIPFINVTYIVLISIAR